VAHWTSENVEAFAHKLGFDFIAQIEKTMGKRSISQIKLAQKLGISEGAVSQFLNNPQNLTSKTITRYARALGLKAAIVAYDDDDPKNEKGPIDSEVFNICWERAGKPHDMWSLQTTASTKQAPSMTYMFIRYNSTENSIGSVREGKTAATNFYQTRVATTGGLISYARR
jgi:transcriptional regulator with XRE-family HTH domain